MPIFLKHTFEAISYSLQLAPINFIILYETNRSGPIRIVQGFLEDLFFLITLHIYSVNTQLQQVVFCYLNTNKLFL